MRRAGLEVTRETLVAQVYHSGSRTRRCSAFVVQKATFRRRRESDLPAAREEKRQETATANGRGAQRAARRRAGAVAAGAVTAVSLARDHCDLDVLRPIGIGQNTFVYAADGTSLGSIPAERNRQPVALVDISPWMRRAAIAVEDRRFYRHSGVDYEGIARALWRDLTEGDRRGRLHARSGSSATSTSPVSAPSPASCARRASPSSSTATGRSSGSSARG